MEAPRADDLDLSAGLVPKASAASAPIDLSAGLVPKQSASDDGDIDLSAGLVPKSAAPAPDPTADIAAKAAQAAQGPNPGAVPQPISAAAPAASSSQPPSLWQKANTPILDLLFGQDTTANLLGKNRALARQNQQDEADTQNALSGHPQEPSLLDRAIVGAANHVSRWMGDKSGDAPAYRGAQQHFDSHYGSDLAGEAAGLTSPVGAALTAAGGAGKLAQTGEEAIAAGRAASRVQSLARAARPLGKVLEAGSGSAFATEGLQQAGAAYNDPKLSKDEKVAKIAAGLAQVIMGGTGLAHSMHGSRLPVGVDNSPEPVAPNASYPNQLALGAGEPAPAESSAVPPESAAPVTHPAGKVTGIDAKTKLPLVDLTQPSEALSYNGEPVPPKTTVPGPMSPEAEAVSKDAALNQSSAQNGIADGVIPQSDIASIPKDTPAPLKPLALEATNRPQPIGAKDPETGREIIQPTDNPAVLDHIAPTQAPALEEGLKSALDGVQGASFERVRDEKNPARLAEKISGEGQPSATIPDFLAAQVTVDSPAAKDAAVAAIKQQFPVVREKDLFDQGDSTYGYRHVALQVQTPAGLTAEVQIVPKEVFEANPDQHHSYKQARNAELQGNDQEFKAKAAEAKAKNDSAMAAFNARNAGRQAKIEDFLGRVVKRNAMEAAGYDVLDKMEEAGESPADTSARFWSDTYFKLPTEAQQRFQRMLSRVSGLNPGDNLNITAGKPANIAESWLDIANAYRLPEQVDYLEGTERGLVALMHEANRRFEDLPNATGGVPTAHPVDLLTTPRPALAKGQQVQLRDGTAATVAYVDPNLKIVRVRTASGENRTVSQRDIQPAAQIQEATNGRNGGSGGSGGNATAVAKGIDERQAATTQEKEAEVPGAPGGLDRQEAVPGNVARVRTSDLTLDPRRFQYKLNADAEGNTNRLAGKKWNDDLAGLVSTWRDPANGKTYVVNGHHRAALAKRMLVPKINTYQIEAPDAPGARSIGAMQNIAEGRGTALDAAKFFRDSGMKPEDLEGHGISLGEATAQNGVHLANLDPHLFDKVAQGQLSMGRGIAIGKATANPATQEAILKMIEKAEGKGKSITDATVEELARFAGGAGEHTETTASLFGDQERTQNLALEKAEVSGYIKGQLKTEKRVFGSVASPAKAETLARAGNKIEAGKNAAIATGADQALAVYDKLSSRTGVIDDILNRASEALANDDKPQEVKRAAYEAVRAAVSQTLGEPEGSRASGIQADARGTEEPQGLTHKELEAAGQTGMFSLEKKGGVRPEDSLSLPGMENADAERAAALAEQTGQDLTDALRTPGKSISKNAGEMERESPLFRDSEASGQGQLFSEGGWHSANPSASEAAIARTKEENADRVALEPIPGDDRNLPGFKMNHDAYALLYKLGLHDGLGTHWSGVRVEPNELTIVFRRVRSLAESALTTEAKSKLENLAASLEESVRKHGTALLLRDGMPPAWYSSVLREERFHQFQVKSGAALDQAIVAETMSHPLARLFADELIDRGYPPNDLVLANEIGAQLGSGSHRPGSELTLRPEERELFRHYLQTVANRIGVNSLKSLPDLSPAAQEVANEVIAAGVGQHLRKGPSKDTPDSGKGDEGGQHSLHSLGAGTSKSSGADRLARDRSVGDEAEPIARGRNDGRGDLQASQRPANRRDEGRDYSLAAGQPAATTHDGRSGTTGTDLRAGQPGRSGTLQEGPGGKGKEEGQHNLDAPAGVGEDQPNLASNRSVGDARESVGKGTTFYSGATVLDPEAWNEAFPSAAEAVRRWASDVPDEGDKQRQIMRQSRGQMDRAIARMAHQLEVPRKAWNRRSREQSLAFFDAVESGKTGTSPDADRKLAEAMRQAFDKQRGELQELEPDLLKDFIENYFPHIWENQGKATRVFRDVLSGRRPFAGSGSFLKQRTVPTIREGVELGLRPASWNPVDLFLSKYHEINRFLMAHKTLDRMKAAKTAQFVRVGERAPDGWQRLDDRIGTVQSKTEDGGLVIRGNYYAPAEAAKVFNNYVSRGIAGRSTIYDSIMRANNAMNSMQLGMSAFHATTTAVNAVTSDIALGIQQLSQGKVSAAAKSLAKGATMVPSVASTLVQGIKVTREYLAPGSYTELAELASAIADAGGRIRQNPVEIKPFTQFMTALRTQKWNEPFASSAGRKLVSSAIDLASRPIMEFWVPRIKVGAFANMAHNILDTATRENWSQERIRARMQTAWNSVDNRFGQMVYDNLFWNKALRDGLMAATRSVGWNAGSLFEIGGGATDTVRQAAKLMAGEPTLKTGQGKLLPEDESKGGSPNAEVTDRMAFTLALPLATALMGTVVGYMLTGKRTERLKDAFFPKKQDGARLAMPGYLKDVVAFSHDPEQTVLNKMSPVLNAVSEMLANHDFYNVETRHTDDNYAKQALQEAQFLAKQLEPFTVRSYQQQRDSGGNKASSAVAGFFGFQPAARYIQNSPAVNLAQRYSLEDRPIGTRTQAEADRGKAKRLIEVAVQQGKYTPDMGKQMVDSGKLTREDVVRARLMARLDPIQRMGRNLSLDQTLKVFAVATPEEQKALRPLLARKAKEIQNEPDKDRRQALRMRLHDALNPPQVPLVASTGGIHSLL